MLQKMFPQDGMRVPEIRFAGFTDEWEQRKLNEIADKVSEKNKNNEFSEPFTNSAEQGIISQKDYFDREIVNDENSRPIVNLYSRAKEKYNDLGFTEIDISISHDAGMAIAICIAN